MARKMKIKLEFFNKGILKKKKYFFYINQRIDTLAEKKRNEFELKNEKKNIILSKIKNNNLKQNKEDVKIFIGVKLLFYFVFLKGRKISIFTAKN